MSIISVNSRNTKALPYNLESDNILVTISLLKDLNISYLENETISVYANFTGSGVLIGSYNTNAFGIYKMRYDTNYITDKTINTAQIWATIIYDGITYRSNKTRVNFIYTTELSFTIIDAGYTIDRNTNVSGIYDADLVDAGVSRDNSIIITRE